MARERGIADVIEWLVNSRSLLAAPSPASQVLRTIYTENADASLNDWPVTIRPKHLGRVRKWCLAVGQPGVRQRPNQSPA